MEQRGKISSMVLHKRAKQGGENFTVNHLQLSLAMIVWKIKTALGTIRLSRLSMIANKYGSIG